MGHDCVLNMYRTNIIVNDTEIYVSYRKFLLQLMEWNCTQYDRDVRLEVNIYNCCTRCINL
jgi:hypothetical protein